VLESEYNKFLLFPANKDELQLVRNLGYDAPSPLLHGYNWNGITPFNAQIATTDLLVHNSRAYVLNDMGTGKTLSALFAFDYLRRQGQVNKMLVVAPLSTLTCVWESEVFNRMSHLTCQSLWHPTKKRRLEYLERDADIYVINHDGMKTIADQLRARTDIDVVVIDELAVFRNKQTDRWKVAKSIIHNRKYAWGMTGSVTPMAPTDAWAQMMLLTPERTVRSFGQFRDKTMIQVSQYRWLPKPDANETVFSQMKPAVRFTRDDCVDLPPTTYQTREVEMTSDQEKFYTQLLKENYAAWQDTEVIAENAGIMTNKLLQVGCGFAYARGDKTLNVPATARQNLLAELIQSCRTKMLVFVPFKYAVDELEEHLLKKKIDVAKIYGDTKKKDRDAIFHAFQNTDQYKVIVAHPQTMAHGLTLTAADTVVWYAPVCSLEIYEQANARITRPSQTQHTTIVHIQSSPIEKRIYNKLQQRGDMQSALLEMFEDMTKEEA
jgi:SNF2 family DNA or RNA helicase